MQTDVVSGRQSRFRFDLLESYFVYIFIFSSGGFYFHLTGIEPSMVAPSGTPSSLAKLNSLFIYSSTLFIYVTYWRAINRIILQSWPLFAFPILALLSALWAPDPAMTLKRAVALLFNMIAIAAMIALLPPLRVIRIYVLVLGLSVLLSILWIGVLPGYGVHMASDWIEPKHAGRWRGIYSHKNSLGAISGIAVVILVFFGRSVIKSIAFRMSAIAAAVACLVGAQSGTGYVTAGIMISVVLFFRILAGMQERTRIVFGGLSLLVGTLLTLFSIPLIHLVLESLGKSPDLTGRLPLWSVLLVWAQERPFLGYGFSSGYELTLMPRVFEYLQAWLPSAHNGYLETFINFGYVGILLLFVLLASFLSRLLISLVRPLSHESVTLPFVSCLFFNFIFSNITESLFFAQNDFTNMSFALAYILLRSLTGNQTLERHSFRAHPAFNPSPVR